MASNPKILKLYWDDISTGAITSINFDVVSAQSYDNMQSITDHPVEVGVDISDHARKNPFKFTLTGFVSTKPLPSNIFANPDSILAEDRILDLLTTPLVIAKKLGGAPLYTPGGLTQAVVNSFASAITVNQSPKAQVWTSFGESAGDSFPDRPKQVYDALLKVMNDNSFIRIVSRFGLITDLLFESIKVARTVEDGLGATFECGMKKIRIVKSATVDAPSPTEDRGASKTSTGSKATKPEDKGKKVRSSAAVQLVDAAGGVGDAIKGFVTGVHP